MGLQNDLECLVTQRQDENLQVFYKAFLANKKAEKILNRLKNVKRKGRQI